MDFNDYQKQASRTDKTTNDDRIYSLMYLSMGLAGETGEVVEKMKKIIRNDKGVVSNEQRDLLKKELGDVLWYVSQLAKAFDISFSEVAQANLDKLADREKRGVLKSEGDSR
jgi:NTP pyrophosphatase (non-canonical NTP hydrolase)